MQSIDASDFDNLLKDLDKVIKSIPGKRRELHERIGDVLREEVRQNVAASVDDSAGRVASWQEKYVGSGGGYAAVRAVGGITGPNSPGAITNYLEGGHKIRRPSGTAKRYKARIKVPYVDGRWFYKKTKAGVEGKIIALVEEFADELARELEG